MASPALSAGASQAPGLLFDMNKLFEAHTARLEQAGAGLEHMVLTQGPPRHLATNGQADAFLLKPDITVWHVGHDGAAAGIDRVIDAKWKRLKPQAPDFGVDGGDVYQLLAYAIRYGCSSLELAYPQPVDTENLMRPPVFKLQAAGLVGSVTIKVKLVPLWSAMALEHDREAAHFVKAEAA